MQAYAIVRNPALTFSQAHLLTRALQSLLLLMLLP